MDYRRLGYSGFDWDSGNTLKIEKRIPVKIVEAFFKHRVLFKFDTKHSFDEPRFIAMGKIPEVKRPLFVAFTIKFMKGEIFIRPISARYMKRNEEKAYAEQIKNFKIE